MIEKACNLWLERAEYRCILTSGAVGGDGEALLETRSAREAAAKYSGLGADLGRLIQARGNHVQLIRPGLCSFPIKQFQWSGPALPVILRSARELVELVGPAKTLLPRPGCGLGELAVADVVAALKFLPDNVVLVEEV